LIAIHPTRCLYRDEFGAAGESVPSDAAYQKGTKVTASTENTATRDDAMLMMQFLRWGTELGLEDALKTIFSDDFDPQGEPAASPEVGKILTFGEALGTMVKQGLLNRELVVDLLWVEGIWARVEPHAHKARESDREPRLYENFEALVK
jgi:hypothetical protein